MIKTEMKKSLLIAFIVSLGLSISQANTLDISAAFMSSQEKGRLVYREEKNKQYRSTVNYSITRSDEGRNLLYRLEKKGRGSCDQYGDITWEQDALMEEIGGFLYTLESNCLISDSGGKPLNRFQRKYDYQNKKISWSHFDKQNKLLDKRTFPIKGKTCDDISLSFFLRTFVANQGKKEYSTYYFLSNEPKLYKVNIIPQGSENLSLPVGEIKAVKLKLRGDVGILDDILDKLVPQTFIWYTENQPHVWLKYQGLETSVNSAYVIAYLQEITPPIK